MSYKSTDLLQSKWRDGECLEFSGVMCSQGEGDMLPLKLHVTFQEDAASATLEKLEPTPLVSWMTNPSREWTAFSKLYEIMDYSIDLAISCGETAANGSQGFIASHRISDGCLYWIAFFPNSNPFAKCELKEGMVIAHSTIRGLSIALALDDPFHVEINVG